MSEWTLPHAVPVVRLLSPLTEGCVCCVLQKCSGCQYRVDGVFIWDDASWDVLAIYPESTTSEGSYLDTYLVSLFTQHNSAALGLGPAVSSASVPDTTAVSPAAAAAASPSPAQAAGPAASPAGAAAGPSPAAISTGGSPPPSPSPQQQSPPPACRGPGCAGPDPFGGGGPFGGPFGGGGGGPFGGPFGRKRLV
jgi:hypothetical protein